ncbi:hypothetical protein GCM10022223_04650 [Kineosporia mesophila]|uniref:L,D-TPase catalytic domain-containing protein n=1 Tax=Kineosporia mesophila TaxID=566012 RepID=A0ABP6Z274_9ACTN
MATATGTQIAVHRTANGPVSKKIRQGAGPLTFLVTAQKGDWLKVHLPTRPNGATGWIPVEDVTLSTTPYRLVVSMDEHRLDLIEKGVRVRHYPIGVGKSTTPTPPGEYYLAELIRPPNPEGGYGPYAFGLSAHSDALTSYAGGPGQLGLHGTNRPDLIGRDVSHGCIRIANDVITELARTVPLGSPIVIQA